MTQQGIIIESSGYRLLGTILRAREAGPRPTALILHGVPGIEKNYDIAHALRGMGWNAVIIHYRGCWGSAGIYNLETIPDDVLAAVSYLDSGKHDFVDRQHLAVVGHSLGGWAAILAAAHDPRLQAVAVYGSVVGPKQQRWSASYTAAEFTPWLQGITPQVFARQWSNLDEHFSTLACVSRISPRPLLVIHGGQDEVIPLQHAQSLFDSAHDPKSFAVHPAADHSFSWQRVWLQRKICKWLTTNLA